MNIEIMILVGNKHENEEISHFFEMENIQFWKYVKNENLSSSSKYLLNRSFNIYVFKLYETVWRLNFPWKILQWIKIFRDDKIDTDEKVRK